MICQVKPIKSQPLKPSSIDKAVTLPDGEIKPDHIMMWSPLTSGPYIVPVSRWID